MAAKARASITCRSRKPELTTILDFFFCSPHPGRVVAAPDDALQEVFDATPCHRCPARLRGHLVQVKRLTAPGKPGVTAPTGRLPTARATPAASSIRSRVLGLAGTPVVRLASRPGVCPARTVITWQRKRFRDHWRRLSQQSTPGRPAIIKEVRELIRAMWQANPTWGSPRIVGELRKLGLNVAKSTVEKMGSPCGLLSLMGDIRGCHVPLP